MEACRNKKNTVELIYSEPMHETSSARISIKVQEGNSRKSPNSNTLHSLGLKEASMYGTPSTTIKQINTLSHIE